MSIPDAEKVEQYLAQRRTHPKGSVQGLLEDLAAIEELKASVEAYRRAAVAEAERRGLDVTEL